jgi:hypothetical protein
LLKHLYLIAMQFVDYWEISWNRLSVRRRKKWETITFCKCTATFRTHCGRLFFQNSWSQSTQVQCNIYKHVIWIRVLTFGWQCIVIYQYNRTDQFHSDPASSQPT